MGMMDRLRRPKQRRSGLNAVTWSSGRILLPALFFDIAHLLILLFLKWDKNGTDMNWTTTELYMILEISAFKELKPFHHGGSEAVRNPL